MDPSSGPQVRPSEKEGGGWHKNETPGRPLGEAVARSMVENEDVKEKVPNANESLGPGFSWFPLKTI